MSLHRTAKICALLARRQKRELSHNIICKICITREKMPLYQYRHDYYATSLSAATRTKYLILRGKKIHNNYHSIFSPYFVIAGFKL